MKRDVKSEILKAGGELIHRQGFNRTGLKEILDAAGVPKGSFYFYFKSKEDFGLALIEHFQATMRAAAGPIFEDYLLSPLARLKKFFIQCRERFGTRGCEAGCPIGNLAQEMSDLSPPMREAVSRVFATLTAAIENLLAESIQRGELRGDLGNERTAAFIIDAWEGALLRMKVEKSVEPLKRFEEIVFGQLLR